MALIACPECGKEVSDQAPACIHCGYPVGKNIDPAQRPDYGVGLISVSQQENVRRVLLEAQISAEQVDQILESVPSVVVRGVTQQQARDLCQRLSSSWCSYRLLREEDLDHPESWHGKPPFLEVDDGEKKKEPMSFGMTVGAVVLGIVAAVFLLSLL